VSEKLALDLEFAAATASSNGTLYLAKKKDIEENARKNPRNTNPKRRFLLKMITKIPIRVTATPKKLYKMVSITDWYDV
jgi:hypothetical protein